MSETGFPLFQGDEAGPSVRRGLGGEDPAGDARYDAGGNPEATAPLAVLITAAGRSERFGGEKKEISDLAGRSVLYRAVSAFSRLQNLAALIITVPDGFELRIREALSSETIEALERRLGGRFRVALGGPTRRDSVRLGLEALVQVLTAGDPKKKIDGVLPEEIQDMVVLVHDGARPWVSQALVERVAAVAYRVGACVPVTQLVETPKEISADGLVVRHPPRSTLATAQTPQGFRLGPLLSAHRRASADAWDCTDDAELWAKYVGPVAWTEGERGNRKITYREDLQFLPSDHPPSTEPSSAVASSFRVGEGVDSGRLVPGAVLRLGGVVIPLASAPEGGTEGDVLLRAVVEALLGSLALGDIARLFPAPAGASAHPDSQGMLRRTLELLEGAGWRPGNLDCTLRLGASLPESARETLRSSLAGLLGLPLGAVSLKSGNLEGGERAGAVEARAVVLVRSSQRIG